MEPVGGTLWDPLADENRMTIAAMKGHKVKTQARKEFRCVKRGLMCKQRQSDISEGQIRGIERFALLLLTEYACFSYLVLCMVITHSVP
jgi:hypothetical protein